MPILTFLSSTAGRWARGVVGVALIALAVFLGGWWLLLAAVGAVFVLVGLFDVCLIAPLAGKPFHGTAFRAAPRG